MSAETMSKLSVENMKRNRSSMRHEYQETIEDQDWWEEQIAKAQNETPT